MGILYWMIGEKFPDIWRGDFPVTVLGGELVLAD